MKVQSHLQVRAQVLQKDHISEQSDRQAPWRRSKQANENHKLCLKAFHLKICKCIWSVFGYCNTAYGHEQVHLDQGPMRGYKQFLTDVQVLDINKGTFSFSFLLYLSPFLTHIFHGN